MKHTTPPDADDFEYALRECNGTCRSIELADETRALHSSADSDSIRCADCDE